MMEDHIRFTRTHQRDSHGLETFKFTAYKNGEEIGHILGRSGLAGCQKFRGYDDPRSTPGCAEPLPEAVYDMGAPEIEAKGGEGWPAGIDGHWIPLTAQKRYRLVGGRGAFGAHPDGAGPGSLGCTVTRSVGDWKRLAQWWKEGLRTLVVDHGLGKVPPLPELPPSPQFNTARVELDGKVIGSALLVDGVSYASMSVVAAITGKKMKWKAKTKTVSLE